VVRLVSIQLLILLMITCSNFCHFVYSVAKQIVYCIDMLCVNVTNLVTSCVAVAYFKLYYFYTISFQCVFKGSTLQYSPSFDVARIFFYLYHSNEAKFGQLILTEMVKIVVTRCRLLISSDIWWQQF